jgi:hypothetical protein
MLYENEEHAWHRDEWRQRGNSFEFDFVCDLRPLEARPALENLERLMQFYAVLCEQAPWPQVRALAGALKQPMSEEDQITIRPYLQLPRGQLITQAQAQREVAKMRSNPLLQRTAPPPAELKR